MTGYATLDRPWESFYKDIEQGSLFINTTPYIGLVENNKDYPEEIAIEYFGASVIHCR